MKITLLTSDLSQALSVASRFATSRASLPVLSNILVVAKKAEIKISATDLEMSVSVPVAGRVDEEGECVVSAKLAYEMVNNLASREVTMAMEKESLVVSSDGFKATLATSPVSEYPKVDSDTSQSFIELQSQLFLEGLSKVLPSVSSDEARPVFTGVLFKESGKVLQLVATDGFRLSKYEIDADSSLNLGSFIVPKKALAELVKLGGQIGIYKKDEDKQVVFNAGGVVLTTRIIDGDFPNFEKIIPQRSSTEIHVSKEDLRRTIRLASVFSRGYGFRTKMDTKGDQLEISSEASGVGQETTILEAKIEGDPFSVLLNGKFVEDFLSTGIGSETVVIKATDSIAPVVFLDPEDKKYLHIIMPLRA